MKKLALTLTLILVLLVAGCSAENAPDAATPTGGDETLDKPVVYATIYPVYALVDAVGGDLIELEPVVPFGVDPHDFEPSAKLIAKLEVADVIFYNGLAMEPWLERAEQQLVEKGVKLVNLSEVVECIAFAGHHEHGAAGHDEDHAATCGEKHGAGDDHAGHQHGNVDPHVWQDPLNAIAMVEAIGDALYDVCSVSQKTQLSNNRAAAIDALTDIDRAYQRALKGVARRELVVGHAAFGYLCHRYDLEQIAVAGLSTHDEPSAALLAEIADLSRERGVTVVFYDALGSDKLAAVIAEEVGVALKPLNPIGAISTEQLAAGEDYFSLMEKNLKAIEAALTN